MKTTYTSGNPLPFKSFLGIKTIKYRIVFKCFCGYGCQKWRIFFPFWIPMHWTNTHPTIDEAIEYINNDGGSTVLSS